MFPLLWWVKMSHLKLLHMQALHMLSYLWLMLSAACFNFMSAITIKKKKNKILWMRQQKVIPFDFEMHFLKMYKKNTDKIVGNYF